MVKNNKLDFNPETITAAFSINRLQMDAKLCWLLDIDVAKVLPETFLQYKLDLVFNEQPYHDSIARLEKDIEDVENEASLFDTHKASRVKGLRKQIASVNEDMADLKKLCQSITMPVQVTELKYKPGKTFVRMRLPDNKINELNDNKHKFKHYQAELTPILPEEEAVK